MLPYATPAFGGADQHGIHQFKTALRGAVYPAVSVAARYANIGRSGVFSRPDGNQDVGQAARVARRMVDMLRS